MTTDQLKHWAILTITITPTATGVQVVVTTNNPCHLTMRWTVVKTVKHIKPTKIRGVLAQKLIDQCFVAYHDNEQEEAGDTLTHTFVKEPWATCETRFFYFFGTVAGVDTPSETCIFKYHRTAPTVYTITLEYAPTGGYTGRSGTQTWAQLHDGAGQYHMSWSTYIRMWLTASWTTNRYSLIYRGVIVFPTQLIPAGADIVAARLCMPGLSKANTWGLAPAVGVTSLWLQDPEMDYINDADYGHYGVIPLSNIIAYADFQASDTQTKWNVFTLNAAGRAYIDRTKNTPFGIREMIYDNANIPPPWKTGGPSMSMIGVTTHPNTMARTKLEVDYYE